MSYLFEYLIYYKFGDCAPAILDYYYQSVHKKKFARVLLQLSVATHPIQNVLNWHFYDRNVFIYDYCHGTTLEWKYEKIAKKWKIESCDKID